MLLSMFKWDKHFLRKLLVVALPIVVQNLVSSSLQIIDGVMIGQLGDIPYAAVTQANRYTFIFQLFLFGISTGCGILLSQYWGKKDVATMRRVMGLGLRMTLTLSTLFILFVVFFAETAVGFFLPRGDSFDTAVLYLRFVVPSYWISAVDMMYATCMKSAEKTKYPMLAGVVAILCNTLLNYVLIYGKLGFPALGVQGAAIATVLSAGIGLTINLTTSYRLRLPSAFRLSDFRLPDAEFMRTFWKVVLPVIINEGLWGIGTAMYSVFYGKLGDGSVAAVGLCTTVDQLVFLVNNGITHSAAILVGGYLGAGDRKSAWTTAGRLLVATAGVGIVAGFLQFNGRGAIISLFNLSADAQDLASHILAFSAFTISLRAINGVIVVGILRSGGDTVFSMFLDTTALWLVGVPLVAIAAMVFHLPVWQVYMFTTVEEIIKASVGIHRFLSKKWMHVLTEREA